MGVWAPAAFPSFSSARRSPAVARDHFVSPTLTAPLASPYINILRLYRSPEGAVDAPGPAAVSAGRPAHGRRRHSPLSRRRAV